MKKVLQINTVYKKGSTGKIAKGISDIGLLNGYTCITAYRYNETKDKDDFSITISSWLDCHIHNRLAKYTLYTGGYSYFKTLAFIKKIKKLKPDIIHLHNLHGNYVNLKLLFKFLKEYGKPVVWTLHDCWALTGQCAYFDMIGCEKWKTNCENCNYCKSIISAFNKQIEKNYKLKKQLFTSINNLTIVTPSKWLADLVKQSYLGNYPIKVINNGIDLSIFKPTKSNFREKYGLQNKKIVLGVAFGWGVRKGLDVFIELSKTLNENYQIVLVGTNSDIDKQLPSNIISIRKTNNQAELAEIYSVADVFINATREDTFPTVNIESLACGTPVITFKTGGSPEIIDDTCGIVVDKNDVEGMQNAIINVCENNLFSAEACITRAKNYDMYDRFNDYVELYKEV